MRSAPTLKIWITPLASVAMLEKLALLKFALCKAPVFSRASWRRTSVIPLSLTERVVAFAVLGMDYLGERRTTNRGGRYSLVGPQPEIETSTVGYSQRTSARGPGLSGFNGFAVAGAAQYGSSSTVHSALQGPGVNAGPAPARCSGSRPSGSRCPAAAPACRADHARPSR